jgi:hypothetical protein
MNKCHHCGTFVPVEKAFCPNCSEPMEPEEAPNRATTSSSDMMATMRDDPEHYKELMLDLKKKPATEASSTAPEAQMPKAVPESPPAVAQSTMSSAASLPPATGSKGGLILVIGVIAVLILIFVMLMVLKII